MTQSNQQFILLSGIISEDEVHDGIDIPLNDNYTLICSAYDVERKNSINQTVSVSGTSMFSSGSEGALRIKAKGVVALDSDNSLINLLDEISSRKTPFVLNIGEQVFNNILLEKYDVTIDNYGKTAECSLIFVRI